jgi:hypothetical protein
MVLKSLSSLFVDLILVCNSENFCRIFLKELYFICRQPMKVCMNCLSNRRQPMEITEILYAFDSKRPAKQTYYHLLFYQPLFTIKCLLLAKDVINLYGLMILFLT